MFRVHTLKEAADSRQQNGTINIHRDNEHGDGTGLSLYEPCISSGQCSNPFNCSDNGNGAQCSYDKCLDYKDGADCFQAKFARLVNAKSNRAATIGVARSGQSAQITLEKTLLLVVCQGRAGGW